MLHVFCPSNPETVGTFTMKPITWDETLNVLDEALERVDDGTGSKNVHWRHTYASIRHLLNRSGFIIPSDFDRRENVQTIQRMSVGDTGILFRPIDRPDLRSADLTQDDFSFVYIERIDPTADSRADERNLETPAKVSRATGVARTTLLSAMDRKEVEHVKMPLGTVLVDIDSATEWANVQHRPHSVKN